MKPNRSFLTVLVGAGTLLASVAVSLAQLLSESTRNDSVVAVVADAQRLPQVPPEQLPLHGTFWSVRNSVPCFSAPLPFPPLDTSIPVYAINDNHFLVDETDGPVLLLRSRPASLSTADYAVIAETQVDDLLAHIVFVQESETSARLSAMDSGEPPPIPGNGGGTGIDDSTNSPRVLRLDLGLCLYPPVVSASSITIAITNALDSGWITNSYDLFYTTNLVSLPEPALCLTNWAWWERSTPGQTNFVISNPGFFECYFRLGTMLDSDGDGLTDAYELLVSHTNPNIWDTDGDGLSDGWELENGMNPRLDESAQGSGRINYHGSAAGIAAGAGLSFQPSLPLGK